MARTYQGDKVRLNVLSKRNSKRRNLKAHTEIHLFNNKEHLTCPRHWYIVMNKVQSLSPRALSLEIKIVVSWH